MSKYIDEELDGLSEAERAALEDEETDASDLKDLVDEGDEEEGEEDEGDDEGSEGEGKDDGEEEGEEDEKPAARNTDSTVFIQHADISALDAQIQTATDQLKHFRQQYRNGELDIDQDTYEDKVAEIQDNIMAAREARAEARAAANANEAIRTERWFDRVNSFMDTVKTRDGIDLRDQATITMFDKTMKMLGNDPDNAAWTADKFLEEAYEITKARLRLAPARSDDKGEDKDSKLAEIMRRRAAGKEEALKVPNLSKVPQAGIDQEGENEFSHLDRLSGEQLEKAISRLTPDQYARYLESA